MNDYSLMLYRLSYVTEYMEDDDYNRLVPCFRISAIHLTPEQCRIVEEMHRKYIEHSRPNTNFSCTRDAPRGHI